MTSPPKSTPSVTKCDCDGRCAPGYPRDELAALAGAGWRITGWAERNHYFGGVTAVGVGGGVGDPQRGGVGLLL